MFPGNDRFLGTKQELGAKPFRRLQMVFTYRKPNGKQETSDIQLTLDQLAFLFSLQPSTVVLRSPSGQLTGVTNVRDGVIYIVEGQPSTQTTHGESIVILLVYLFSTAGEEATLFEHFVSMSVLPKGSK